jgi:hypothetical protein
VIEVRALHDENAEAPMDVTLVGKVTEVRAVHDENALAPILMTPEGIVTAFIGTQPKNASAAIAVVPAGMMNAVEPDPTKVPAPVHDVHVIDEILVAFRVPLVATVIPPVALMIAPTADDVMAPRVETAMDEALRV